MIESILGRWSHFLNRCLSNQRFRSYEEKVLHAWRDTLSEKERQTLDAQLLAADLMQRQAGDAKVCFCYPPKTGLPMFGNQEPCAHVATVCLSDSGADERRRMNVKLFLVNGKFFSLEFPKRPARFMPQRGMRLDALQVIAVEKPVALD